MRRFLLFLMLAMTGCLLGAELSSDQAVGRETSPVEAGREALRDGPRYPWYDAKTDEVRRIEVTADTSSSAGNRDSTWREDAASPSTGNFSLDLSAFWTLMQVLAWTLLAAILIGIVALLVWAFMRAEGGLTSDGDSDVSVHRASDVDRVESLPFQVKRPRADLLAEARRQYELGNYGEAIVYLFSYQLVQLDKQQLIHLTRGKTNRQYLREVRRRPRLFQVLETTMIAFEDVFFGHHELERDRFEACWSGLDDFHQHLENSST